MPTSVYGYIPRESPTTRATARRSARTEKPFPCMISLNGTQRWYSKFLQSSHPGDLVMKNFVYKRPRTRRKATMIVTRSVVMSFHPMDALL